MDVKEKSKNDNLNHIVNENEIVILPENSSEILEDSIKEEEEKNVLQNISQFRTLLPQVLAVSSINLILLNLGMILALPTIIIPQLLESKENLNFTEEQASWFGSIAFIFQPFGSIFSGFLFEPLGRKKTMIYVNLPLIVGWLLIRFSTSVTYLYAAEIIMGLSIGFLDAPHITYLGEITHPKWRGILTSYAELCVSMGFCVVYFLGAVTDWRTVSAIGSSIPVLSIILISQIPESPIWLLSKNRKVEAQKSLCWLRGWVDFNIVRKEFAGFVRHNETFLSQRRNISRSETEPLNAFRKRNKKFMEKFFAASKFQDLFQKSILLPLFLVVIYFGFSHTAGITSTRPFMVDILKEFGTTLDPFWVTSISSVIGIIGFIAGMIILPKIGKRVLSIISMVGCAFVNGLISIYALFFMHLHIPWIPDFLLILLNFLWSLGIGQIPWMLISEVFPFGGRGIASGIAAAISYIQAFILIKTYYFTHNNFTLSGVFALYSSYTVLGSIFLYVFLPETEGKTLEQIERILEDHCNKISTKIFKKSKDKFEA